MTLFEPEPSTGRGGSSSTGVADRPDPDPLEQPTPSRVRLVVAYDGAAFHGFARNEGVQTVGGTLTDAISTVLGQPVELTCAGRTDKGVHARAQVVTFDVAGSVDLVVLVRSLNKMCAPSISVLDAVEVDAGFDARFSAVARRYRYQVLNRPMPDPFTAASAWHVDEPLQLPIMTLACDAIIGEHDFSAFCRRPKRRDGVEASLVRRVTEASWFDDGAGRLRFEIEASSFCHQMVRSVVGTLVAVGRGRIRPGDVLAIMRAGERRWAGELAPPHGLTLWSVSYPGWTSSDVPQGWPPGS